MASLRCHLFVFDSFQNTKGAELIITKLLHFNHNTLSEFVQKIVTSKKTTVKV